VHTLENASGLIVRLSGFGARIVEVHAPDRHGDLADIALGLESEEAYEHDTAYLGCIAGRCCNRIAEGRFCLDGREFRLPINNGPNHLHGGVRGFDRHAWHAERVEAEHGASIRFSRVSPDGEEGYPGELRASVAYTLTEANRLIIAMEATTDTPTLCNLTQHAYWNLAGHDSGSILGHVVHLDASRYTPVNGSMIPTGAIEPVAGTAFDFTRAKPIGRDLATLGGDPPGYDHNFVVDGDPGSLRPVARVLEPRSGRVLELLANQPGVQFYTGNFLEGSSRGKRGARYGRHAGFCLETQCFPDAVNKPGWIAPVLRPGQVYRHLMEFRFGTDRG